MTSPTPGSWYVDEVNEVQTLIMPPQNHTQFPIARMGTLLDAKTQAANARLIAAAPDLLEAAQGAIAALSQPHTYPADIEAAKTWLARAVAKATEAQ
jgi:hypothetical protein